MNTGKLCPRCFTESLENGSCSNCGFSEEMAHRNPNALKRFVFLKDRYLVGEVLGSGGFGITYKVFDSVTDSYKAVKEYFPSSFSAYRNGESKSVSISANYDNQYKRGLESFYKEAQVLFGLQGIRSVVRVEDFFRENGTAYIVMEYVDGVSLNSICKASGGTVQFDDLMKQFIELSLTLDEVHMCGIAHRDVSPGNIMILPDGSVKLIDFGAARYVDRSNKTLSIVLKEGFAPIEQYFNKGQQGPWTDIYALACTMYWYVTGVKVPDAPTRQNNDEVVSISKLRPDIPKGFSAVIKKAMEVDYEKRYQNVSEMIAALEPLMKLQQKPKEEEKEKKEGFFKRLFKNLFGTNKHCETSGYDYFIEIVCGPLEGMLFKIPENGVITIGRSSQYCNAVINAKTISRLHCSIRVDKERNGFELLDYSSTGTYISGQNPQSGIRVSKNEPAFIRENERFWISDPAFTLRVIKVNY